MAWGTALPTDGPTPPWGDGTGRHWRDHGWGGNGRSSKRRPPWWPDGEPWPPEGPEAWRALRRRFARRAALFAAGLVLALILLSSTVVWALTSLLGGKWISLVFGFAVILAFALLARRVVRFVRLAAAPMGELIEASARVEAGQLGIQVREHGPREARTLARAFNAMSRRLAETEDARRQLLADVSHELRTPLTVIQGNVEGMLDGLYPADRPHLERLLAETNQLERLIEDLRTLSLAEAGAMSLARESTDLGALAADVVAGFESQADVAGIQLSVDARTDLPELELDPLRVRQVVGNLVSNALRHTPRDGRVVISVTTEGEAQLLTVADTGAGMEPAEVSRAFDRFWRSDTSPGAGLGLAIVRDLVAAHGGETEIRSAPGEGTTVLCRFPRQA